MEVNKKSHGISCPSAGLMYFLNSADKIPRARRGCHPQASHGNMAKARAKSRHAPSGRRGGKRARGANPQSRRNLPVSDSDDAFTRSESIDTLPGGEGEMDEGEGHHPPESSSAPSFSSALSSYVPCHRCHNHGASSNVGQSPQTLLTTRSI